MKKPPDSIAVKTNGDFSDLRSSTELPTIDSSSSGRSELPALAKEVARWHFKERWVCVFGFEKKRIVCNVQPIAQGHYIFVEFGGFYFCHVLYDSI
ncbi:uncharacterized protein LOC141718152 isoform X2 [Apium graveolens]|uniref:uncharacterized protein LOC141718152 isoform X2 n=1 Tax=Apium graveolens TaxID=4045 RepID=UPI003D7BFE84